MIKQILTLAFLLSIGFSNSVQAQLPDGAIAPNWTLTDIDGNTHTLYDYLDQGKMVVLEFSATWCGPCWNYMLTGALETVWEEHGPGGDNTVMMFYVEADQTTDMDDLLGLTPESQGNWVDAIPFPIIDLQAGENQDLEYQIAYYPTLFAICSDRTLWELGQVPAATWSSFITSCTLEGSVEAVTEADCYGEGSITIDYQGGVAPIDFDWSNGDNGPVADNLGAGLYSVTITDDGGKWIVLEDIEVTGAETAVTLDDSNLEEPLCNGLSNGAIDVEITGGTPGYSYDWNNGSSTEDISNISAGTYTLVVTDLNGCTAEYDFDLEEPDEISVEAEVTPENCDSGDGTITLSIEGGTGDYEVTSSSGDVFGNQIINLTEGTVTATVEDENGCVWEQEYEIEFFPAPEVEIQQGEDLTCTQLTTSLTGFAWSGSGDFEFYWSTTNGTIVSGINSQTAIVSGEGTYTLEVSDFISGCQIESSYEVEAEIILPEVNAGDDLPVSCENSLPVIQGSGDVLNTITWTTLTGNIVSGETTYTPTVDAPGVYYISVVHSGTGCSNIDSVEVLDELDPALANFQFQTNNLTMITNDLSTGSNLSGWSWTFGDGNTSNSPSPIHTYATEGTYEVCLTVQNGCGPSQTCYTVEVTFSGSVLLVESNITDVLCFGENSGSIDLTVNGGSGNYTYSWIGPDSTTYSSSSIADIPAGNYTVTISDDQNNTFIGGYTVDQPPVLEIGSSSVVDNVCFGQLNGSISVELTGGVAPYLYSWNGGPPTTEFTYSGLPAGSYDVLVTDANGCTLLIGPYSITEPPALLSQNTVTDVVCHGEANGAAVITVSGGVAPYLYSWSGDENFTPEISGVPAGHYSLAVTDANGCIMDVAVVISQPDVLIVNSAEVVHTTGPEQADGSINIQVSGGTAPYIVTWSNGATGTFIEGLLPGIYTYEIKDAHGCIYNSPTPIEVHSIVGTDDLNGDKYVSIMPNPSDGNVVIEWKEIVADNASLSIMTLDGRMMETFKIESAEGSWNLLHLGLTEGVYIALLKQEKQVYPFKLVVIK